MAVLQPQDGFDSDLMTRPRERLLRGGGWTTQAQVTMTGTYMCCGSSMVSYVWIGCVVKRIADTVLYPRRISLVAVAVADMNAATVR